MDPCSDVTTIRRPYYNPYYRKRERLIFRLLGDYSYYDTPDGQDGLKKMWYMTKASGFIGVVASFTDAMFFAKVQGFVPASLNFASWTIPAVLSGMTFSGVSYLLCNVRGKDDLFNPMIAGASVGYIWSFKFTPRIGGFLGLFFCACAVVKKMHEQYGVKVWCMSPSTRVPIHRWNEPPNSPQFQYWKLGVPRDEEL